MANYIELATGRYPVSESQIKAENPQTSYPKSFPVPDGFALVFPAPAPAFDPITQYVHEIAPVLTVKGTYQQDYEIINLDPATAAANQAAATKRHNDTIWQQIANLERDSLMPRALRDLIPADHPARAKVDALEAEIAALKAILK